MQYQQTSSYQTKQTKERQRKLQQTKELFYFSQQKKGRQSSRFAYWPKLKIIYLTLQQSGQYILLILALDLPLVGLERVIS